MYMKKIIALLFILAFSFSSCEKDDICDANTPTTPRLVIQFYNANDPSALKNVTDLKVIGEGMTEGVIFNSASITDDKYITNGNTISIPLKTDANSTTYQFILNSNNPNEALIDTDKVTFNYTRQDVFVSRACGFKTLFTFATTNKIVHTAVPETKQQWMQIIAVQKNNIDNENETHIKVYF